jgi:hypothetical protein
MTHHPPLRGSREAPTFDGAALHLNRFFADVDLVLYATGTVYSDAERIRKCKYYVDHSTAELWDYVVVPTWGAFKENIRTFYPGSEDSGVYRHADLERIVLEKSREEIKTLAEYGNYLREFTTVATDLCTHGQLGEQDRERMFLNGFSGEVHERILFRLQVLDPSHHLDDPYPSASVQRAIEWVLSASRAAPTVPVPTVKSAPPTVVITPPPNRLSRLCQRCAHYSGPSGADSHSFWDSPSIRRTEDSDSSRENCIGATIRHLS